MTTPMHEFKMTDEQRDTLLEAMKPTPVMVLGGYTSGMDRQDRANTAWKKLGEEMGFDYETVRPIKGKDSTYFEASPLPSPKTTNDAPNNQGWKERFTTALEIAPFRDSVQLSKFLIGFVEKELQEAEQRGYERAKEEMTRTDAYQAGYKHGATEQL